ncbi:MAG: TolC family protein [Chitinophagaceae bacterium]
MQNSKGYLYLCCLIFAVLVSLGNNLSCLAQENIHLDSYLQIAKARSPLLREYRNAIASLSIDSEKTRAGYKPQVALVSTNMYAPSGKNFGYDQTVTNGGQFSTVVAASKTFVSQKNLQTQFQGQRLSTDSIRTLSAIAEQELKRSITAQYLTAYGDQQQLLALAEINSTLQDEEGLLKSLTQNNIYRQTDYLTFLVTQRQQALQLRQMRIQYLNDYANLANLCGIVDTTAMNKKLLLPELRIAEFPAEMNSAFFARYKIDSLQLDNTIRLINFSYRPKVSVFADAGYNATQLHTFYQNFGVSAGFSVNLPIYDGGRRKLSITQMQLSEDTRSGYHQFFQDQFAQQIAALHQQLNATENLAGDIDDQIKYSKGLIDVNAELLKTGDVRIPDFVLAINNYLMAKTLRTQNQVSRLQIINQINYWNR